MSDKIEIDAPVSDRRTRFFARAIGTKFVAANKPDGNVTEIDLYDEVGFYGVNAKSFRSALKDAGDVKLRINSPGGDVFDGIAIYNDLLAHDGNVTVEIVGLAASIASIIAMAGDTIAIADNAMMMIHNAWTIAVGNKEAFTAAAETLGKIDSALALTYASRKGTPGVRAIKQMMDAETWMNGKEAVASGFATELLKPADKTAQAKFDLTVFNAVPSELLWPDSVFEGSETDEDIEKILMRDAGYSRTRARAFIKDTRAGKTSNSTMLGAGDDLKLDGLLAATHGWPKNQF